MKTPRFTRGSTLLLVLWALFVLSATVFAWAKWIQQDIQISGLANRELEARAMAHSGLAIALHPLVSQKTPLLEEQFEADLGFKVKMVGEGGKLNINWLLAGEEPRKLAILTQWLEQMELTYQERNIFIDCLLDYIDGDNVKRLNGVEDEDGYHPANRPFQSIEEIEEVANSKLLTSKPGWKDHLTIYSQGPIDLTSADEDILRLLPGLGEARIARFLTTRRGKDGIDGTIDDPVFKGVKEVFSYLGIGEAQGKELGGLVSVNDQVMRITSVGTSAKVVRQVEVVARKGGAAPAIIYWKE
jgi:type II secretory pathway component PulK